MPPNINFQPTAKVVAKQLRKPSGLLAKRVAQKMNESNRHLYNLTINQLEVKPCARILEIGFGNGRFFEKIFTKAIHLK